MIRAIDLKFLKDYKLEVTFSDGATKIFDYAGFLDSEMGQKLKDQDFFRMGKIGRGGRDINWEKNGEVVYDNCVDAMRYFWDDDSKEWEGFDDSIGLNERIKITDSKRMAS